eukprot:CAMPEP_0117695880 /NCGR_PEP_ID=MMETSP0804-20121206/28378_1 /TAXON_ID=1074897 /ORGANISM="Tetraselmis astigmatica, Strain CCMP880" /LENGTH=69 /DNA_ID=CAMNT_0005509987 /DNA_START=801 /DNA_END=1006 /DNA_ORIENTATION=+
MEAYVAIAASIARCDPPLLQPHGALVVQAPGGDRGHIRVSAILRQAGFQAAEAVCDVRGVRRAVVSYLP